MQATWTRSLSQVTGYPTIKIQKVSKKGGTYTTDAVKELVVRSTGEVTEVQKSDGTVEYKYPVVDRKKGNLSFIVGAPQKVNVEFGTALIIRNLIGGPLNGNPRGWFKCDEISVARVNK